MNKLIFFFTFYLISFQLFSQAKTIHVFVALCDNENQGIYPVPEFLGKGDQPKSNLYWSATYGIKSYFSKRTTDWKFIKSLKSNNPYILERIIFKHTIEDIYLLADAYNGAKIKDCIEDFLLASNGQKKLTIELENKSIGFGGTADLVSYIGHDGLMEFQVDLEFNENNSKKKDAIILACYSKNYFYGYLKSAGANPLLWTTHLMAPEAYTLKSALDGWIKNETPQQIDERAAQSYNKYQKCGIKGARNLFTTGF